MPLPHQSPQPRAIVGEGGSGQVVLGADTHQDLHVAVVISNVGVLLGSGDVPTTATGYRELLAWARAQNTLRRAGVEGTASSDAALARMLGAEGVVVIEVNQPDKAHRRRRGKTDALDAEAAAASSASRPPSPSTVGAEPPDPPSDLPPVRPPR